jgi:hypothetical protein
LGVAVSLIVDIIARVVKVPGLDTVPPFPADTFKLVSVVVENDTDCVALALFTVTDPEAGDAEYLDIAFTV